MTSKSSNPIVIVAASVLITFFLTVPLATASTYILLRTMGSTSTANTSGIPALEEKTVTVEEESATIDVVAAAEPAVVSVIVTKDIPRIERYYENPFGDEFFNSPFNLRIPRYRQDGTEEQEIGGGTAFFVSSNGMLLTNKHVVADPEAEYSVLINNEEKYEATVLLRHPFNDLALLSIEPKQGQSFPYLNLASSDNLQLGQQVIAIGNALGEFRNTVSTGVISGLSRNITAGSGNGGSVEQLHEIIQTDAAINPGNSGGPLLALSGDVVGINTAVASGAQNIGFALPSSEAVSMLADYQEHGKIIMPYLGVRYTMISKTLMGEDNFTDDFIEKYGYGALVIGNAQQNTLAVIPGSPADKAGIVENDIILKVNDNKVTLDNDLASHIRSFQPGETVTLTIYSKGEEKTVEVILEEFKNEEDKEE